LSASDVARNPNALRVRFPGGIEILLAEAEGYPALRRKIALLPIDNRAAKDAISLPPVAEAELWRDKGPGLGSGHKTEEGGC